MHVCNTLLRHSIKYVFYNNCKHTLPLTLKHKHSEPGSVTDEALAVSWLLFTLHVAMLGGSAEGNERDRCHGEVGNGLDELFFSAPDNLSTWREQ